MCKAKRAELLLKNGKVLSIDGDGVISRGTAIAVSDGRILSVFDNDEEAEGCIDADTRLIDCQGHTILPGLCDAHCHPSSAASILIACQLFDIIGSPEETSRQVAEKYKHAVAAHVREHPSDFIVRGTGWNRAFFTGACRQPQWPDRHDLDEICADRPIVLESFCQHALWVNTKALEMAGITKDTPDPKNGQILREEDGSPSGILLEMDAINRIKQGIEGYDFSVEQYKDTIRRYQSEVANCYGITLVNDCMHTENAKKAYKELAAAGALTLRVRGVYHLEDCKNLDDIKGFALQQPEDQVNDLFAINTIKIFLEGQPAMLEPFEPGMNKELGAPLEYSGETFWNDETVESAMVQAMKTDMQIHIHAMGDKAVRQAVRCLTKAQEKTGTRNRNVIAHIMSIKDEDIRQMGESGIIASLQPRWMVFDADAEENYFVWYGKDRTMEFYPNKRISYAGCVVAYGTDFPVSPPPNPFYGLECAQTRSVFAADELQYEKYKGTILGPDADPKRDCVDLASAVRSASWAGAYQMFLEAETGSIEPGKSADLVVLDTDLEQIETETIHAVRVEKTVFKGKVVYSRNR